MIRIPATPQAIRRMGITGYMRKLPRDMAELVTTISMLWLWMKGRHTRMITAHRGASRISGISPISTPKLVAMALPPRPLNNIGQPCPATGASTTGTMYHRGSLATYMARYTGTAPFRMSSTAQAMPMGSPQATVALAEPGFRSAP